MFIKNQNTKKHVFLGNCHCHPILDPGSAYYNDAEGASHPRACSGYADPGRIQVQVAVAVWLWPWIVPEIKNHCHK